jgi:type I restriction enzyme S subunit
VHFIEEKFWPLNTTLYIKEFHGNYERCVYYFLRQFNLKKYSSGAGVPTLNRNNVHGEKVWFPKSLSEQQSIVNKLDKISAETKKLETIYAQKLADLEELKKSILQKAFEGALK